MDKPKRILLYGFGPYRQFNDNISARIIKSLPARSGLKRVIFPVRFQRSQFIDALHRHVPQLVLGLGQSARKRIEIELQAKNRRRARKSGKSRPIHANGPKTWKATLEIKSGRWISRSMNAGDYVCNYSMFVLLDEIGRRQLKIPFGFIHIPHDYDQFKARRVIQRVLRQCQRLGR
jgi:pyroglutamyl-peptidase